MAALRTTTVTLSDSSQLLTRNVVQERSNELEESNPETAGTPRICAKFSERQNESAILPPWPRSSPSALELAWSRNNEVGSVLAVTDAVLRAAADCAVFERGDAEITMGVIKQGGQWQILSFNVSSPGFFTPTANSSSVDPPPPPASPPHQKLQQPASVEEAQREAVRRYPDIAVAGSRLNREFLTRHKRYQAEQPKLLRNPLWPLRIAEESARALEEK